MAGTSSTRFECYGQVSVETVKLQRQDPCSITQLDVEAVTLLMAQRYLPWVFHYLFIRVMFATFCVYFVNDFYTNNNNIVLITIQSEVQQTTPTLALYTVL